MTNRRVESILTSAYAISQENTTESQATTKEQLGFVRDSLDDIRDVLTDSSDVKKNQIGLAENQLAEMNKNINAMLGILEGQYNLQKESQDLIKRAAAEGKSTVKPTVAKKTTPIAPSTTSKLTGGLGDLLSTLTGLLGFGTKAGGPMLMLRQISRLPIRILTKSAGLILKSSMGIAKAGLKGLDLLTGRIVSKFASKVGSLMGGLVGKAGRLLAGSLKLGIIKLKKVIQEYKNLGYSDVQITAALQRRMIMDEQSNSETLKAQARLDSIIRKALGK